jgi:hypothetical protein
MAKGSRAGPPSRRLSICALVAIPGVVHVPRPALAAEPGPRFPANLVYERAPGAELCPDEAAVQGSMAALLGQALLDRAASSRIALRVGAAGPAIAPAQRPAIAPAQRPAIAPAQLEGHIELRDADGKLRFANDLLAARDDCATLVASLSLSLRVAIEGSAGSAGGVRPSGGQRAVVVKGLPTWPQGQDVRQSLPSVSPGSQASFWRR